MIPPTPKKVIVGVGVSMTSYGQAAESVAHCVERNRETPHVPAQYVCVTSVHGVIDAHHDPSFRDILNEAYLATPDGMPIVWAMRSFGARQQQRVYGPTLMLALCEQAARLGHRIFLYGARPDTLSALCLNLRSQFPDLQIAGTIAPPFRPLTPEEDADCVRKIHDSGADLVFIGLSTPKQERWMHAHRQSLPATVMVGVGAAFDFHAGQLRQAPSWLQDRGLEWLFRLAMEPKRLWRRYLLTTPLFLPLWGLQKLGFARYRTLDDTIHFNAVRYNDKEIKGSNNV